MRKKIVAANWKMNLNLADGQSLVDDIVSRLPQLSDDKRVVIAPPYLYLTQTANEVATKEYIYAGAQNCSSEASGAYTGEISAAMLADAGVQYVILGHSERREYFKESSELLVKKMAQARANGLQVIFCCGEPLSVRDSDTQNNYVQQQIEEALFHFSDADLADIAIAYEPIWAIGTGRTATSQQAQDMHAHIRSVLAGKWGAEAADNMTILYGGSCNAGNAAELFSQPDVDGGLIGGASLKAETFLPIIEAMMKA